MTDNGSFINWRASLMPLVLIAIGILFAIGQAVSNVGIYIQSWLTPVEHPASYTFPAYSRLLSICVMGNLVDYQKIVAKKQQLSQAVDELAHTSPDKLASLDDQACFWINAYNLLVIKSIADSYPITDLRQIGKVLNHHKYIVGGHPYSVEAIKTSIMSSLIAQTHPELLFTVCGGTRGYPPLINHPIDKANMSNDMEKACHDFINDGHNVRFDRVTNALYLSPFFRWNAYILAKDQNSVLAFVNYFLNPDTKISLADSRLQKTYSSQFNWSINDMALATPPDK